MLLKNSTLLPHKPAFPLIGQPFIILPTVDSTNNYAMAQAQKGLATHGSVYLALEQTAGKGQRGKQWMAAKGENIMLSVVLQPKPMTIGNPFILSASVALACHDFFNPLSGEEHARIKWPNDLYWQDRKAGGILIESSSAGAETMNVVVGIGININQTSFDPSIKNPVSLKQITGKEWDIITLSRALCARLEERWGQATTGNMPQILETYNRVLYKRNQPVRLKKENVVFETSISGVSADGRLITHDAVERSFDSGGVEWII